MHKRILACIIVTSLCGIAAPAPTLQVLPWNGYQGAYSWTMDDFCSVTTSSLQWADSVAHARNLSFGFAIVTGSCKASDWAIAKAMVAHGAEPINHSFTHSCPDSSLCKGGPGWNAAAIQLETDSSTRLIQANTGYRPTFFTYPFGPGTLPAQASLVKQGYMGQMSYNLRSYANNGLNPFPIADGLKVEYDGRQPAAPDPSAKYQLFGMDPYADSAVSRKAWALRATHGVGDASYAPWTQAEFIKHLDHLAALRDRGLLWVATPSVVLKYCGMANALAWNLTLDAAGFHVQWTTPPELLAKYAGNLRVRVTGSWSVTQAGTKLTTTLDSLGTLVSVNPAAGNLTLLPR